jgi:N-acetyl-alpha-D-muramate 1-phosphate uridylyltransferase
MKAMILAAGLGTRFKPWTDKHPKALALVNNKSLLERNVDYLRQYGIKEIIVNVHHFADQVREAILINKGWGSQISISDESGQILETGGGLKKAAGFFGKEPFVLVNVDVLTDLDLRAMISHHFRRLPLATLAVMDRKSSRYFLFDDQQELCGWRDTVKGIEKIVKKRAPLIQRAFSGVHIIDPKIFSLIKMDGKFSMVDLYLDLAASEPIVSFEQQYSNWVDVGKPASVAIAESLFP